MNEQLRQTGRSTRTVERAVQLASQGRAVYIVTAPPQAVMTMRQVDELWAHHGRRGVHGIKVETPESLGEGFNWDTLRIHNAHPNSEFLVDHFIIEKRIVYLQRRMAVIAAEVGKLYPLTV